MRLFNKSLIKILLSILHSHRQIRFPSDLKILHNQLNLRFWLTSINVNRIVIIVYFPNLKIIVFVTLLKTYDGHHLQNSVVFDRFSNIVRDQSVFEVSRSIFINLT